MLYLLIKYQLYLKYFIDVCQLRLDFVKFELNNPPSSGDCSTSGDYFTVTQATGGRKRFGYICGTNTGQHSNLTT